MKNSSYSFAWKGVMPAITTQFTANNQLDTNAFCKNLHAQVNAGATGIILGGTLGEASTLTAQEKHTLVSTTIKEVGKKAAVILNIAEQSTEDAINAAKNAETLSFINLHFLHWGNAN